MIATVYLSGDTILIKVKIMMILGFSCLCYINVNTNCCRGLDNPNGGGSEDWYLPDGVRILNTPHTNFYTIFNKFI